MATPTNSVAWRDTTDDAISALFLSEIGPQQIIGICKRRRGLIGNTWHRMMTILECFRSISKLLLGKDRKSLPEDVVFDILSRLPAEDILNCRTVCKRWMALTSTRCFLDLHLTGAPPIIFLHHYIPENDLRLYSIDLTAEEPCIKRFDTNKLQLDRLPRRFGGICDGLVLFWSEHFSYIRLYICNPLAGRMIMEVDARGYYFCGFWFHPVKREYFFLTVSLPGTWGIMNLEMQFMIFNLRGESTELGWYKTVPSDDAPINISGSLYYLLQHPVPPQNCIMILNIDSETIEFKSHPHNDHCGGGHVGIRNRNNADMCLLEVDGLLGFTHVCSTMRSLNLWILVDRATWHWVLKYKVNLYWDGSVGAICALSGIQKGEMLLHYNYRRLIAFNFESRRIRKIDISIDYPKEYGFLSATICGNSLVDLNRLGSLV